MVSSLEQMPLSCVAQIQKYEPTTSIEANPVITQHPLTKGVRDRSDRGWQSASSFSGRCFYPPAALSHSENAFTLGQPMVSQGLGWEHHDIEYIPIPSGCVEWGTAILERHSLNLKGDDENGGYIYGAIYCSLGH